MSSSNICLTLALHDPTGELLPKAKHHWLALEAKFQTIVVHSTTSTHPDWEAFLSARNVPTAHSDPSWDQIGLHRRRALQLGVVHSNCPWLLYSDPDHVLRWVERQPLNLDAILLKVREGDCLVLGRTAHGFASTPLRLRQTEAVVNEIFRLVSGFRWDTMMGTRGFARMAAEHIVARSDVETLGNDVAWPLILLRDGFKVCHAEAEGLTYETNHVFATGSTDTLDAAAEAWMLRVYAANQHVDAMRPFLSNR